MDGANHLYNSSGQQIRGLDMAYRKTKIRYLGHAGVFRVSGLTNTDYRFYGHGSVLSVRSEDAPGLLSLTRQARSCCGNHNQTHALFARA